MTEEDPEMLEGEEQKVEHRVEVLKRGDSEGREEEDEDEEEEEGFDSPPFHHTTVRLPLFVSMSSL